MGVVLNVYRRGRYFRDQVDAVRQQTVAPSEIFVWQNGLNFDVPRDLRRQVTLAQCERNLGVWARLAYALNLRTEFICMLDDDTIPGRRWFENCLQTMSTHEGLLGARGLRFWSSSSYFKFDEFGWAAPNATVEQVDIVGHAWFFKADWLRSFWSIERGLEGDSRVGEDIHFSFALQQHLKLNTYVPPHPIDEPELWGSLPEFGHKIGTSLEGISMEPEAQTRFQEAYRDYIGRGFQLCSSPSMSRSLGARGSTLVRSTWFSRITSRLPVLGNFRRFLSRHLR